MFAHHSPDTAVARTVIQRALLDREIAQGHQSLATFAHELELAQERHAFGLAEPSEVEQVEERLVTVWHDLIELSSLDLAD